MVALVYMLFALLSVLALAPPRDERLRLVLYSAIGVVLVLAAGFRPSDSVQDYVVYESLYNSIVAQGWFDTMLEPTFSLIALVSDLLVGHPILMFVVYALLGVCLKMTAIRQLSDLWFLGLVLYFGTFFLQQEMVQMRAGVATGFILLSLKPLYERRTGRFLLLMAGAILFHYSALAFLPVWFLSRLKRHDWILWGIVPLGFVLFFAGVDLLALVVPFRSVMVRLGNALAQHEAGWFDSIRIIGPANIMRMVPYFVLLCFHTRLLQHNRHTTLLLYIYGVGLFLGLAFGRIPVVAVRLSDLYVVVEIILLPMLAYVIKPRVVGRLAVVAIAFCHVLLAIAFGSRLVF